MYSKKSKGKKKVKSGNVAFLNPRTCGIYKNGGIRYKTDAASGQRTEQIDNELIEVVDTFLKKGSSPAIAQHPIKEVYDKKVLVPRYFDKRWNSELEGLLDSEGVESVSIGELVSKGILQIFGGHGSPSNDQRLGHVPYIKVSDLRCLRVNVNPTNLVSEAVAKRFWGGDISGLQPWDLITPNRASSNIGEFIILLPGEERLVITKEVFIFRIIGGEAEGWDPFYLFWALCLKAVRNQWQRITLMQTNREDCGSRHLEILLPNPISKKWAAEVSAPFREYFQTIASAKEAFLKEIVGSDRSFIASVYSAVPEVEDEITNVESIDKGNAEDIS